MQRVNIQIEKVASHSDIIVVRIEGPLDTVASYAFHEKLKNLIAIGNYKFIINLEQLDYISSAGIGVFPGIAMELKQHDGGLVFVHVSPKIFKLFEMIGLTTMFKVTDSQEQAIKEFAPA